jgi:hypothetical protein
MCACSCGAHTETHTYICTSGDVRMWDTRSAELTGHRCKGAAGPAGASCTFEEGVPASGSELGRARPISSELLLASRLKRHATRIARS